MNVFVLCTGRCGSVTFSRACQHIDNYSAGHESNWSVVKNRCAYADNHIEVDNRLVWFLGRIDSIYGDDAFYVHLKRNIDDTSQSLLRKSYPPRKKNGSIALSKGQAIMWVYRNGLIWKGDDTKPIDVCRHYCETVNTNIELF